MKKCIMHSSAPSGTGRTYLCASTYELDVSVGHSLAAAHNTDVDCPKCLGILVANRSIDAMNENKKRGASDRQVGGSHYRDMVIEPWDVFESNSPAEFVVYLNLTAQSYLMRAGRKGSAREDMQKAIHCLEKAVEVLKDAEEA